MSVWELPTSLEIQGRYFNIRTDFRAILDILRAFNDPNLEQQDKYFICLKILYTGFDYMPEAMYQEALQKAFNFIDMGNEGTDDKHPKPTVMDWEQDSSLIIPPINRILGHDVRLEQNLHWWTFLGYYMEIGECLFATVVSIRNKKAKGKRLEKWEKEFYKENKSIIDIEKKYSDEEIEERKKLNDLWNF